MKEENEYKEENLSQCVYKSDDTIKFWNFDRHNVYIELRHSVENTYVYSIKCFATHVKGGDCWYGFSIEWQTHLIT